MLKKWKAVRGDDGAALVETAFIFILLVPMLLFLSIDVGQILFCLIELSNSAHAGSSYIAQQYAASANLASSASKGSLPAVTDVKSAVKNDASDIVGFLSSAGITVATPTLGCSDGTTPTSNATYNASGETGAGPVCPAAAIPTVTVTVTGTVMPMISIPGYSSGITNKYTATTSLVY